MEAVSKESLEGMQLIPTPLRAEEEHRDLGRRTMSPTQTGNPKAGLPLSSQTGALKAGPCLLPQTPRDSHPFSKAPASPLHSLSSTHLLAQAGSLGGANVHLGERRTSIRPPCQGSDALQALSMCPQDKLIL